MSAGLWRLGLSVASPGGVRGRLSILIFHRVLAAKDQLIPDSPDVVEFEQQMKWVRRWFNVLPLATAVEQLFEGSIPSRAMAITFDDGYADNLEVAAPLLARLGLHATFFVTTGYLGGTCMWNDRVIEAIRSTRRRSIELAGLPALPLDTLLARRDAVARILPVIKHREQQERQAIVDAIDEQLEVDPARGLMMSEAQVHRLHGLGMEIGAHTVSHPILSTLPAQAAFAEMQQSKASLEAIIRAPVRLFAYPNGVPQQDYGGEHVKMARDCGFSAAVSTAKGAANRATDRLQLPRFTPWDRAQWKFGLRLGANLAQRRSLAC